MISKISFLSQLEHMSRQILLSKLCSLRMELIGEPDVALLVVCPAAAAACFVFNPCCCLWCINVVLR